MLTPWKKSKPSNYRNRWRRRISGQIFNKIIEKNQQKHFPKLRKDTPIQIEDAHRTPNRENKNKNETKQNKNKTPQNIVKTLSTHNK